ncbi:MAG TPA: hypothetical protein VGP73_20865 [Thermoanaerobaculia bacterium]
MRNGVRCSWCLLLLLAIPGPARRPSPPAHGRGEVRTEMRGVDFRIDPDLVLEVRHLRGALEPTRPGKPPWFDDPGSFTVRIDEGEIAMTPASLAALMNRHLFAGPGAPVKDVTVEFRDGHLIQTSTLNKKVPVRATLEGDVSATPDGDILFHPTKIEAGKVSVKKLLDLLGVELSGVIKSQEEKGLKVQGDDLILDPGKLLPPPRIRGRLTAVRIEGDRMIQTFGGGAPGKPLSPSFPKAKNYMFMSGGLLSFGKLTMNGADLQIIDADPKDPFDFYLAQYAKQLVAGYSRTMPDKGLVVYMPDSNEAGKPLAP